MATKTVSLLVVLILHLNLAGIVSGLWEYIGSCAGSNKFYMAETSETVKHSVANEICTNNQWKLVSIANDAELTCLLGIISDKARYWTSGVVDVIWTDKLSQVGEPYGPPPTAWHKVCMRLGKADGLRVFECYATMYYFPLCEVIQSTGMYMEI